VTPSPDALDDAGQIDAQHGGQGLPRVLGLACADLQIQGIDAAGLDPHQHLPRTRRRTSDIRMAERAVMAFHDGGLHGVCA